MFVSRWLFNSVPSIDQFSRDGNCAEEHTAPENNCRPADNWRVVKGAQSRLNSLKS